MRAGVQSFLHVANSLGQSATDDWQVVGPTEPVSCTGRVGVSLVDLALCATPEKLSDDLVNVDGFCFRVWHWSTGR